MTLTRRIKYQLEHSRRQIQLIWRGYGMPKWLVGNAARVSYLSLLGVLLVIYVCQVSSAAGIGYEMRDLQRNNETLRQEIRQISVEVATYNALPNLEKRISTSGLSRVSNITYMSAVDSIVAKR